MVKPGVKMERRNTFWTTPTAACKGVKNEYGSWHINHEHDDWSSYIYALWPNRRDRRKKKKNS